jgi:diaminopropionate ammonia-lyase
MGAVVVNAWRSQRPQDARDRSAVTAFHRALPGYRATPLVRAPALEAELGVPCVWVKDETERFGLPAFKAMGASWAVAVAVSERLGSDLPPSDGLEGLRRIVGGRRLTLVTATDGNHGRAVAWMAAALGVSARIFVPEGIPAGAAAAIASEGASLVVGGETYDDAVEAAAKEDGGDVIVVSDTSWAGYERIPEAVLDGYGTIFDEASAQLAEARQSWPAVTVVPVGVGSLATAAVRHVAAQGGVAVSAEPETAAALQRSLAAGRAVEVPGPHASVMAGLNCGAVSAMAWPELRAGIAAAVTVSDDDARWGVAALRRDGVDAGTCAGAAASGLRTLLADPAGRALLPPGEAALLLATEGARSTAPPAAAGADPAP